LQSHGALQRGATLDAKLGVELEVGAADPAREGPVEQSLDVIVILASAAGGERHRGEEQEKQQAAHAGQGSYAGRNSAP
jgi:hypothetical protein